MRSLFALALFVSTTATTHASSFVCLMNRTAEPVSFFVLQQGQADVEVQVQAQADACHRLTGAAVPVRMLMHGGKTAPCSALVMKPDEWLIAMPNGDQAVSCVVDNDRDSAKGVHYSERVGDRSPIALTLENKTKEAVKVFFRELSCLNVENAEFTIPARGKVTEKLNMVTGGRCQSNTSVRVDVKPSEGSSKASASVLMAVRELEPSPFCLNQTGQAGMNIECAMRDKKSSRISIQMK